MRTDLAGFVLNSLNRIKIVQALLANPKRPWSCSALEDTTKLPHATVFRTLRGLYQFNLLTRFKINKKDFVYELVSASLLLKDLEKLVNLERNAARKIAKIFVNKAKKEDLISIILYGSTVEGELMPQSDIDILLILKKHHAAKEHEIQDIASEISLHFNKTVSVMILSKEEIHQEKESQFLKSVQEKHEVLYGKEPF